MKLNSKNLSRRLNQTQPKNEGNARACNDFGCSATPAPTPPGTDRYTRKAGVGAGLYNNQTVGAGVRMEEVEVMMKRRLRIKVESQKQHRGKPPYVSLMGQAGFSTPFPEGLSPSGPFIFKTLLGEAGYERA
jgi:hypothetical protein